MIPKTHRVKSLQDSGFVSKLEAVLESQGSPEIIDRETLVRTILYGEYKRTKRPTGDEAMTLRWNVVVALPLLGYERWGQNKKNPTFRRKPCPQ